MKHQYDWCTFNHDGKCPAEYLPGSRGTLQSPKFELSKFGGPKQFFYKIEIQLMDDPDFETLFCATGTLDQNNMPGLKNSDMVVVQVPFQEELR